MCEWFEGKNFADYEETKIAAGHGFRPSPKPINIKITR